MPLEVLKLLIGRAKIFEKPLVSSLVIDHQPTHREGGFDLTHQREMIGIASRIGQSHGSFPGLHRSF